MVDLGERRNLINLICYRSGITSLDKDQNPDPKGFALFVCPGFGNPDPLLAETSADQKHLT